MLHCECNTFVNGQEFFSLDVSFRGGNDGQQPMFLQKRFQTYRICPSFCNIVTYKNLRIN